MTTLGDISLARIEVWKIDRMVGAQKAFADPLRPGVFWVSPAMFSLLDGAETTVERARIMAAIEIVRPDVANILDIVEVPEERR